LDEREFLAPNGIRALSRIHKEKPFVFRADGAELRVEYLPGESDSWMFGGNSNWRGPIWFPVNFLVIGALERFARRLGDAFTVEFPRGSGTERSLREIATDLAQRMVDIFLIDRARGRRPVFGDRSDPDPTWGESLLFHEYFHGDDGRGLGASHQTGWTGLVADMIIRLSQARQKGA
jgi:hypothetical protein